ncbi:MAG TPA: hypothetical protein VEA38_16535 [Terriglobales bacterium]|nr:hypothetical protein [Terriglobales bacterium]
MLQTMPVATRPHSTTLRIGVGLAEGGHTLDAVSTAATAARAELDGVTPHLSIVVTTAPAGAEVARTMRAVLGPVGLAGGVSAGLLTDHGLVTDGALVICVSNAEGAVSGVAATGGRRLAEAAQAAARLVLAGWPFRGRYPRGIALAFTAHGSGTPAAGFLNPWRELMGPKMRTVCGAMSSDVYGATSATPLATVGCLEAPYLMGLGVAVGADLGNPEALVHGSADATRTALKWLEGRPARVVLALESAARFRALGAAAEREWAAIREQVRDHDGHGGPCVGWLCEEVAAYGRGVHPVDVPGGLVVAALGDPAREV